MEKQLTILEAKDKLLAWLKSQLGYHEICDNNTKYADSSIDTDLYGFDMHGQPWCDYFVDYAFIYNFGYELGTKMTYQCPNGSAACAISARYYKDNNVFYNYPEVGDQIFFYYGGDINHTGIVIAFDSQYVTTIEGNSSDSVQENRYYITDRSIAGYGRPNWNLLGKSEEYFNESVESNGESNDKLVLQYGRGLNNPDPLVSAWQSLLVNLGFYKSTQSKFKFIDGEFGKDTELYTKVFQEYFNLPDNGIVNKENWLKAIEASGG